MPQESPTTTSRRTALRVAGAALTGTVAVSGTAAADGRAIPPAGEYVDGYGDDAAVLERYQPAFDISRSAQDQAVGIFGWYADNDDRDERAIYYWNRYSHQDSFFDFWGGLGTSVVAADDHLWDHEPTIVYTDRSTGEVLRVVTTGYHHFAAEQAAGSDLAVLSVRDDFPTHVGLQVVDPWHHHQFVPEGSAESLALIDNQVTLGSWLDTREDWYNSEVYEYTAIEAIEDPWRMLDRPSWWREGELDAWFARYVWLRLGRRGADSREELRFEE